MILTDEPNSIYLQHSVPMKYRDSSMYLIISLEKLLQYIVLEKISTTILPQFFQAHPLTR